MNAATIIFGVVVVAVLGAAWYFQHRARRNN